MITGWKKLNKSERKHLSENKIFTNSDWNKQIEFLRSKTNPDDINRRICFDCFGIAHKLGIKI